MLSSIASFLLGVVGWIVTKLFLEPFKEIHDLRREAQECLIIQGDLAGDAAPEDRRGAAEAFRRVGAGLVSRHIAANRPVAWWCDTRQGWDINSAGRLLLGIAESIQSGGFSAANASPTVALIRQCLRLPTPGKPPTIQALEEDAGQPGTIQPGDLWL